jgi:hypothetical protein
LEIGGREMNDSDRLYDLVDRGLIDWYDVAEMCLKYMREDDIAKMIDENELPEQFFEDEGEIDDGWAERVLLAERKEAEK